MARFFLIDHSLKDVGGHHFDLVRSVGGAANAAGHQVVIGCHQRFQPRAGGKDHGSYELLKEIGDVEPVFRETVYQGDSSLAGLRRSKRTKPLVIQKHETKLPQFLKRVLRRSHQLRVRQRKNRVSDTFAAGCDKLFREQHLTAGDRVMVTAASELEVSGAAKFLRRWQGGWKAPWHFLFHFNVFDGWGDEYASQKLVLAQLREDLLRALSGLPKSLFHFHTTTETLAGQYHELNVGSFDPLPYPISTDFLSAREFAKNVKNLQDRPIRLVCAGAIRREKGQVATLQQLVNRIDESYLLNNKVQLVVQRAEPKWPAKPKLELRIKDSGVYLSQNTVNPAIDFVRHPLPRSQYQQLLQSADVGLFCYDSRSYFSRCAGILVEMLAAGKPVIVPAGTWLADQIQEPIQNYIRRFRNRYCSRCVVRHDEFEYESANLPSAGGVWSCDRETHSFVASAKCDHQDRVAVVQFGWHWPQQHGRYVQVKCIQSDDANRVVGTSVQSIGIDRGTSTSSLLYQVEAGAKQLRFRLTNAFGSDTISVRNFSLELYADDQIPDSVPQGAVGVIASSPKVLPECVSEMIRNVDHYRESANVFANYWIDRHHPQRTIDRIFQRRISSSRAA